MMLSGMLKECLPKGMELLSCSASSDFLCDPELRCEILIHLNELMPGTKSKGKPATPGLASDILRVVYNEPATVVFWRDGTKTVVKCQDGDQYSKEQGLAMCIVKKVLGNKGNYNNVFKKWCAGGAQE